MHVPVDQGPRPRAAAAVDVIEAQAEVTAAQPEAEGQRYVTVCELDTDYQDAARRSIDKIAAIDS